MSRKLVFGIACFALFLTVFQREKRLLMGLLRELSDDMLLNTVATSGTRNIEIRRSSPRKSFFQDINDMNVLVAVVTSRSNLHTRGVAIMDTWGQALPDSVTVRFFVGAADTNSTLQSGSPEDLAHLAQLAHIPDPSWIYVMKDIADNEYPPVRRNTAMLKYLDVIAEQQILKKPQKPYHWILKVDDDAYLHMQGMQKFLNSRNPEEIGFYGEPGTGRAEDEKGLTLGGLHGPFCMGGSGYAMTRPTLKATAQGIDECVAKADASEHREFIWHSDVVVGMCVQDYAKVNCWSHATKKEYKANRVFRHCYDQGSYKVSNRDLPNVVVMHPFKNYTEMMDLHIRFQKVVVQNKKRYAKSKPAKSTTSTPGTKKSLPSNGGANTAIKASSNTKTTKPITIPSPVPKPVNVLVAVVSSRDNFHTRTKTIMETWGQNLPDGVTLRFFVGADANFGANATIQSGSPEDVAHLAKLANIQDTSQVVVMEDIRDDEYPPVRKNTAMLKYLDAMAKSRETNKPELAPYQWILKVDDDAYLHSEGMLTFLRTRDHTKMGFFGQRGMGRPEDKRGIRGGGLHGPYCMGGSGYVMSRPTLRATALGMDKCVATADASKYRKYLWHSDVIMGLCVQNAAKVNCWSNSTADYTKNQIFRHCYGKGFDRCYGKGNPKITDKDLPNMVVMHPFKDSKAMMAVHQWFQRVVTEDSALKK